MSRMIRHDRTPTTTATAGRRHLSPEDREESAEDADAEESEELGTTRWRSETTPRAEDKSVRDLADTH